MVVHTPRHLFLEVLTEGHRKPFHGSEQGDSNPKIDVFIRVETSPAAGFDPLASGEHPAIDGLDRKGRESVQVGLDEPP